MMGKLGLYQRAHLACDIIRPKQGGQGQAQHYLAVCGYRCHNSTARQQAHHRASRYRFYGASHDRNIPCVIVCALRPIQQMNPGYSKNDHLPEFYRKKAVLACQVFSNCKTRYSEGWVATTSSRWWRRRARSASLVKLCVLSASVRGM